MTQVTTPAQLAQQLKESYAQLCSALDRLTPDEIEQPQLGDGWTPKVALAHIAFWDDYQTRRMEAAYSGASAAKGFARPPGDNDERAAQDQARPWAEVVAAANGARQRMVAFAEGLPEVALTIGYREGDHTLSISDLLQHMVRHTFEHLGQVDAYCATRPLRTPRAGATQG